MGFGILGDLGGAVTVTAQHQAVREAADVAPHHQIELGFPFFSENVEIFDLAPAVDGRLSRLKHPDVLRRELAWKLGHPLKIRSGEYVGLGYWRFGSLAAGPSPRSIQTARTPAKQRRLRPFNGGENLVQGLGLPVLRTMVTRDKELSPRAFRVFGPKLIGMRGAFSDPALESRFLTEETGTRLMRGDIPIHLPAGFKAEALALRNRLLGFRLRHFHDLAALDAQAVSGLEARTAQTALALLSLIDDAAVRAQIAASLALRDAVVRAERSQTIEALLIEAVLAAFEASSKPVAPISDITDRFNAARLAERSKPLSTKSVGHMLRNRLRLATEKTRGVYVVPARERAKAEALAQRFAVSAVHDAIPP